MIKTYEIIFKVANELDTAVVYLAGGINIAEKVAQLLGLGG